MNRSINRPLPSGHGPGAGLGTFAGVFTPSVLTILGIILFLRLGYVTGSAGLGRALIIIAISNAISVLTSVSLAAVATNLKVKKGGDYYLISRTLGIEFGGAIGIVLFLAQSVSIGFYCLGFGEAVVAMTGGGPAWLAQIIAAAALSCIFVLAWLGADAATRFQFVIMGLLVLALASFFAGGLGQFHPWLLKANWSAPQGSPGFWVLFAIFFPAVTGFTQGVSMSGDLKDAGKSLPLGTFMAVGISIAVYFGAAIVFAGVLPNARLAGDYQAMKQVAFVPFLIDAGVIAATLSSAMASFLGAPRILQSVAADRVVSWLEPFAQGHGSAHNPRRGVLLAGGIGLAAVGLGELNLIAPVVSMFFLVSYGLLNYATYFESRSQTPSFRPRFKLYDSRLSLAGFLVCLGAMLAIDLTAGLAAVAVLFGVYQYIKHTAGPSRWADSRRSHYLQQVRENLAAAGRELEHPRNWRPQIIAFSDHPERRERLLRVCSWLEGGSGTTTAVRMIEDEGPRMGHLRQKAQAELQCEVDSLELGVFSLAVVAPELNPGLWVLLQSYGVGPLKANLAVFNWPENLQEHSLGLLELQYGSALRGAFRLGVNLLIFDGKQQHWERIQKLEPKQRRIDVLWTGDATSRLMLLLAYLMTRTEFWEGAFIRVLAPEHLAPGRAEEDLNQLLDEVRIEAQVEILPQWDLTSLRRLMSDAAFAFFPFKLSGNSLMDPFGEPLAQAVPKLPLAVMVLAAQDLDLDAEPEEGKVAQVTQALDQLAKAEARALDANQAADKARQEAQEAKQESKAPDAMVEGDWIARLREALKAKEEAGQAARRAAKELAKVEDAARLVKSLGLAPKVSEELDLPSQDNGNKDKEDA